MNGQTKWCNIWWQNCWKLRSQNRCYLLCAKLTQYTTINVYADFITCSNWLPNIISTIGILAIRYSFPNGVNLVVLGKGHNCYEKLSYASIFTGCILWQFQCQLLPQVHNRLAHQAHSVLWRKTDLNVRGRGEGLLFKVYCRKKQIFSLHLRDSRKKLNQSHHCLLNKDKDDSKSLLDIELYNGEWVPFISTFWH